MKILKVLPLGADINASVYKAEINDELFYFVKLKRGHQHNIGPIIGGLLHDAGVQQIVLPIQTIEGQSAQQIDDFTLMVYPFIEGQDGFSRGLTDSQWVTLGKALRQVHEMSVSSKIQGLIRREVYSSKWRDAVCSLYNQIEAGLPGDQPWPSGQTEKNSNQVGLPFLDEVALKLLKFMKENKTTILRLVHRAEQLSQKAQSQSPKFVLCHSDIHGGNVVISTRDEAMYIVDWDEPIIAPKERDLMFIGGGVGNIWNQPNEEKLFYKGYGKTEVNSTILAYYRHERIIEDIALYGQDILLTAGSDQNRSEKYKQFVGMFAPRGVVDIALKTPH